MQVYLKDSKKSRCHFNLNAILVYVVARLVVKVEDVSVTKTICYVLKCVCENCTNCENEFDSEFETDDEDEGHLDQILKN